MLARRTMLITGGGPVTSETKQQQNPAVQCMSRVGRFHLCLSGAQADPPARKLSNKPDI